MLDRLTEAFAGQREFIADASHELRTPLTVIRGQLEVLAAQEHPSAQEVRRVEALVRAEVARVSRLVDDLLLLARSEHSEQFLRPEPIALDPYVEELWDGMTLLAERRFELGPLPRGTLLADRDRLAQALRNLISNAINHTAPEQGLVRLTVRPEGDGRIRFVVDDDGPGIPRPSATGSSTASTAPTPPATVPPAAPVSGSRSCARSRKPTEGRSRPAPRRRAVRAWSWCCPASAGRPSRSPAAGARRRRPV